jgi:hypothetical protein
MRCRQGKRHQVQHNGKDVLDLPGDQNRRTGQIVLERQNWALGALGECLYLRLDWGRVAMLNDYW